MHRMTKEKSKPSKEQCLLIPRERVGEEQRNKRSTIYQKSNRNWYSGLVRYRIISNSFCTATSPITYTYACTYTQRAEENEKADDISIKRWIFPTCTTERERLRIKRSANTMLKLRYISRAKKKLKPLTEELRAWIQFIRKKRLANEWNTNIYSWR